MSKVIKQVQVIKCDLCLHELQGSYVSLPAATFIDVVDNETISTTEMTDRHFCNRAHLLEYIGANV